MEPFSPSRRPHLGYCRRQEDCDGRCVVRGRRSLCPGRRPRAGHGPGARGGAAAITAQPLPPGSSSPPSVAARSLSSPLGGSVRPLRRDLLASGFGGGDVVWRVYCSLFPVWRPLPWPWVKSQLGRRVPAFCLFPECLLLLPFPSLLLLSVWVLPNRKSIPSTLPWLNPALLRCHCFDDC